MLFYVNVHIIKQNLNMMDTKMVKVVQVGGKVIGKTDVQTTITSDTRTTNWTIGWHKSRY